MSAAAHRFLSACRLEPTDRTPVWIMRQAGRYMAEYRRIRERYSLLEICESPEVAVEVTLQPVRKLGVDAAILFSDLLVPFRPMGLDLEFVKGEGPRIHNPVATATDIEKLRPIDAEEALSFTLEAIRLLRRELDVPLIGFAGAPFTLASYAIEGGPSRNFEKTKALMYESPEAWHRLLSRFADVVLDYLKAQIGAGARAVQLFDSWAGALSPADYREYAQPHSARILKGLEGMDAPRIHFGTGTAGLLPDMRDAGADVVGVDWRIDLDRAWKMLGEDIAVQGNLDPLALMAPLETLRAKADRVLEQAARRNGHIFNLGHGVLPTTPVEHVRALVDHVHERTAS